MTGPAILDAFAEWVDAVDLVAAHMCTPRITVRAQILPDWHGTPRAYWTVRMHRFSATLPLMDCICRETPSILLVCTTLGPLPSSHYGAATTHCHAWHPEKVAAYVQYIAKPPRHIVKGPPTIRYREWDYVSLEGVVVR